MADPDRRGNAPQSETVHAPHRDDAPPQRSAAPKVWIVVGLVVLVVALVALIWVGVG